MSRSIKRARAAASREPTCGLVLGVASLAVLAVAAACGVRQRPPGAGPEATREGETSVRVLTREPAPEPEGVVVETITPAYASDENELPEYPAHALEAGCQQGIVPIRVYVGADGNVERVDGIPDMPVANDQCHSAFWGATCIAVQDWRFAPAFRQRSVPGLDFDGDGQPDFTRWEQTAVRIYLDFEFTFRVVDGKGEVRTR